MNYRARGPRLASSRAAAVIADSLADRHRLPPAVLRRRSPRRAAAEGPLSHFELKTQGALQAHLATYCSQKVIVQLFEHSCTQHGDYFYKDMSGGIVCIPAPRAPLARSAVHHSSRPPHWLRSER
ncbi:hypothetical protein EYF80_045050 [Liparis tanakae]|uniref:Uncharacterized protein n=1 Tax=Liparis tanakae TaxID=230148 RepID=A0A4Z2FV41_9TELE|nr:hypothetical protein EYF80_045050 [Liparis tanakae]